MDDRRLASLCDHCNFRCVRAGCSGNLDAVAVAYDGGDCLRFFNYLGGFSYWAGCREQCGGVFCSYKSKSQNCAWLVPASSCWCNCLGGLRAFSVASLLDIGRNNHGAFSTGFVALFCGYLSRDRAVGHEFSAGACCCAFTGARPRRSGRQCVCGQYGRCNCGGAGF